MRAGSGIPPARAPAQLTKGEGYGSNRSREGPHPSSSGRWPAERGRRRAGAARLARSKGPPAPRDDDGRKQKGNVARPRSRPHVLISAEPRAIDRGIPLRTVTARLGQKAASAGEGRGRKKNPADGGAQVLGRTNSEGRRVRSASTNAQPRARFRPSIKNFWRPPSRSRPHEVAALLPVDRWIVIAGLQWRRSAIRRDSDELRLSFNSGPVSH
jgi:hypothetical protein